MSDNKITCPRCNETWTQHGNASGHCAECHRTFYGEGAFDKHQTHGHADGRPRCLAVTEYAPGESGNTFWADHEGQWHYGKPVAVGEYQERVAARDARMAALRYQPVPEPPNSPEVVPVHTPAITDTRQYPVSGDAA